MTPKNELADLTQLLDALENGRMTIRESGSRT